MQKETPHSPFISTRSENIFTASNSNEKERAAFCGIISRRVKCSLPLLLWLAIFFLIFLFWLKKLMRNIKSATAAVVFFFSPPLCHMRETKIIFKRGPWKKVSSGRFNNNDCYCERQTFETVGFQSHPDALQTHKRERKGS
jgi:hypothetical protein